MRLGPGRDDWTGRHDQTSRDEGSSLCLVRLLLGLNRGAPCGVEVGRDSWGSGFGV